jgi:4-amino-4-deoxy-L-arabinose transferase-like glycosyltransferase
VPQHIRRFAWVALAILVVAWFGSLHSRHLIRTDEGRYASIAREMAASGDYVTPTLNQLKYFYKPPLQYWATAIAFNVFGETPFAARLWGALTAFLAVFATWFTLKRLCSREVGLAGAAIHAGMLWVYGMAHINTVDSALAAFLHMALCAFLLAYQRQIPAAQKRYFLALFSFFLALAVMSKGLIGALIPACVLGLYVLISRDWSLLTTFPWMRATLVFFAVTAPWFILVAMRNPEFNEFFFINEHFRRFTSKVHRREGAWWYFVPILMGGLVPWTGLALAGLSGAAQRAARDAFANSLRVPLLLGIWCVFIFLFFSVSGSKLPSYILPMFGAFALFLAPISLRISPTTFVVSMMPITVLGLALMVASHPYFVEKISDFPERLPYALEMAVWFRICAIGLILTLAAAWWWRAAHVRIKAILAIAALSVLAIWAGLMGHNVLAPAQSGQGLAQQCIEKEGITSQEIPFYSVKSFDHTLPFYLKRSFIVVEWRDELELGLIAQPERFVKDEPTFLSRWSTLPKGYAVMEFSVFERLKKSEFAHRVVAQDLRRVIVSRP